MHDTEFEELVSAGIDAIPPEFKSKLNNVAITFADAPTVEQLQKNNVPPGSTLFGLYEGIPLTARSGNYSLVAPDKITIFKHPIVQAAHGDKATIKHLVIETVWHEVGHHFGLSEAQIRALEQKHGLNKPQS